jgi:dimethylglycine catabolism B
MSNDSKSAIPRGLHYIAENIIDKHNILGAPDSLKTGWSKKLRFAPQNSTIFFAGCGYQYISGLESLMSLLRKMDKSPLGTEFPMQFAALQKKTGLDLAGLYSKIAAKDHDLEYQPLIDAVHVLQKLGIEVGYLGEKEPCCGGLLYYSGMEQEFKNNAVNTYNTMVELGVKKIISIVPSCTYTLKNLIPRNIQKNTIEVLHFLEVVYNHLNSIKLEFPGTAKVTYHDPCQLSRFLGIIREPRAILNAIKGVELIETAGTNQQWSTCCGGGGGFEAVFPELSEILAVNRTKELIETNADIIVTQCPGCSMQIKSGLEKLKINSVKVLDMSQIIAMSLEK